MVIWVCLYNLDIILSWPVTVALISSLSCSTEKFGCCCSNCLQIVLELPIWLTLIYVQYVLVWTVEGLRTPLTAGSHLVHLLVISLID